MELKLYHQIDPTTGEILGLVLERYDQEAFNYIREQEDDWKFFHPWRKVWPHVKPLLSELKLFRRYINAERAFKTVGDRPELKKRQSQSEVADTLTA